MSGFAQYDTEVLVNIRGNLLKGLDRIAETIDNGTFRESPSDTKGGVPPAEFGCIGLWFLRAITLELKSRNYQPPELTRRMAQRRRNGG